MKSQQHRVIKDLNKKEPSIAGDIEPKPQGIGMAVAFDWGLVVQILAMPFLPLFLSNLGKAPKVPSVQTTLVSSLFSLPFAALLAIFGEGVRRGWRWTRPIQLVFNALLFVAGFFTLPGVWRGSREGNYWPIVTSVILLIFSPLIVWRLSRPATKQWFATVNSIEARKRHGGAWPWLIALWSITGGVLQAIAALGNFSR